MDNYEAIPNKIRKIWQQTDSNENNSNNLESGLVKLITLNYNKVLNQYDIVSGMISSSDPIIYKVKLTHFPESILPNLKTILSSNSSNSTIESHHIGTTIYIFYQGAATITITLNIVTPQNYNQITNITGVRG